MTKRDDIERHLDARQARRMAAEHRMLVRQEQRERAAERDADRAIGELCREGQTVFYINHPKYRESTNRYDLVAYLMK